jgi:hypothetical protein
MNIVKSVGGSDTLIVGFAFRLSSLVTPVGAILGIGDGSRTHVLLIVNNTGTLTLSRSAQTGASNLSTSGANGLASSTNTIVANTWYYIELKVKIHGSTGTAELHVNGSATGWFTATGLNTQNAGSAIAAYFQFGGTNTSIDCDFDDVYVNDLSGSDCNTFMGDQRVDFHLPDADGANSGWTCSTGTSHYQLIDENPPNTTDYNSTLTLNAKDTMSIEAFKNDGADILAIQINVLAQKSDAGTCAIDTVIRESGVDAVSGLSMFPSTSWRMVRTNYSIGVADTKRLAAGFDAAEWGYQKTA